MADENRMVFISTPAKSWNDIEPNHIIHKGLVFIGKFIEIIYSQKYWAHDMKIQLSTCNIVAMQSTARKCVEMNQVNNL